VQLQNRNPNIVDLDEKLQSFFTKNNLVQQLVAQEIAKDIKTHPEKLDIWQDRIITKLVEKADYMPYLYIAKEIKPLLQEKWLPLIEALNQLFPEIWSRQGP